jgi:hypothetical protein
MAKIQIPITKWGEALEVDTDKLDEQLYRYVVALGLKQIMNRGMTKVTKEGMPDEAERKAEAKKIAEATLVALYENKIRMTGGVKPKTTKGAETTEAMRLGRIAVKDMIKAAGGKISHYDASEISKAAEELIAQDPSYREQARKNLEARENQPKIEEAVAKAKVSSIAVNLKKVAAAEAKKAERKAGKEGDQLSKTQAAKPKGKKAPVPPAKTKKEVPAHSAH